MGTSHNKNPVYPLDARNLTLKYEKRIIFLKSLFYSGDDIHALIRYNKLNSIKKILENDGTIINNKNERGWPPLMTAVLYNQEKIVQHLLEHGASVDEQNPVLHTSLHVALIYNHVDIACVLIKSGADLTIKNKHKKTPLDYVDSKQVRDLLNELSEECPDTFHARGVERKQFNRRVVMMSMHSRSSLRSSFKSRRWSARHSGSVEVEPGSTGIVNSALRVLSTKSRLSLIKSPAVMTDKDNQPKVSSGDGSESQSQQSPQGRSRVHRFTSSDQESVTGEAAADRFSKSRWVNYSSDGVAGDVEGSNPPPLLSRRLGRSRGSLSRPQTRISSDGGDGGRKDSTPYVRQSSEHDSRMSELRENFRVLSVSSEQFSVCPSDVS